MFLLRMMFWIAVVIMLLPADAEVSEEPDAAARKVTVIDAVDAASTAVTDVAGICSRNEAVCETGAAVWAMFLRKAEYGARLVYDLASDARVGPGVGETGEAVIRNAVERGSSTLAPSRDTLTSSDREPPWRGPAATRT